MAIQRGNDEQSALIELIVREVLAKLASPNMSRSPEPLDDKQRKEPEATPPRELRLAERVISAGDLAEQLGTASQISISKGAVITPAARDLMKQRGLTVLYHDAENGSGQTMLLIASTESRFDTAALVRTLEPLGATLRQVPETRLINLLEEICRELPRDDVLGLLLTCQTAAAACLANRRPRVRAAVALKTADVADAVECLGINLLVVDPAAVSQFQLRQMTQQFLRGGVRVCPPQYQQLLG